jgi:hypothetical protein
MRSSFKSWFLIFVTATTLSVRSAGAEADIRIINVEKLAGNKTAITFEDSSRGFLNYLPSFKLSLGGDATNTLDLRRVTEISPGIFQSIIPDPPSLISFFQIAGFRTPDADNDGLSDALESILGTSTNTFDTDGDHFGDANEIANGSNPLKSTDLPNIVKANFESNQSSAREGDGTIFIPITFSRAFRGTLRYSVASGSTAVAGVDFGALSGLLDVDGTSAAIPVSLLDDLLIEDVKLLVIDLVSDPENGYQTGGASRATLLLYDNDATWSGVLREEGSEQSFRLRMLKQGTTVQAALISKFDTNNPALMQGIGSIPPGEWTMASTALTTNSFATVSTPIPMGSSTLFGEAPLNRIVSLNSEPGADGKNPGTNYLFKPNLIIGTFTDRFAAENPNQQYLAREASGIFVLAQDLPVMPFPVVGSASASGGVTTTALEVQR